MRALAVAIALVTGLCHAQIRTDASLGRPPQSIAGPNFTIPQTLGTLAGNNLFFSFLTFNIGAGQSATFVTTTPALANVVSRVTGGSLSVINGALRLQAAGATPNFFLVNPAGVLFGGGASLDVPGAFHVSTADYVRFGDGQRFHSDPRSGSTLSTAPPEAFGFLGTSRAAITFANGANLQTSPFQPASISAGDIQMSNARLASRGGEIRVLAVGERVVEVPLSGNLPAADGTLNILNGAQISAPSFDESDGGVVRVSAGNITILNSGGILSEASFLTNANGGDIIVNATGHISLVSGGVISADSRSSARGGSVSVTADSITIDGRSVGGANTGIRSQNRTESGGRAGTVDVSVRGNLLIMGGGEIDAQGQDGRIRIDAGQMTIDGGGHTNSGGVFTLTVSDAPSPGRGGDIEITVRGNLTVINRGIINADSSGGLDAGNIVVDVGGDLAVVDGGLIGSNTAVTGNAGSVRVTAGNITIGGGESGLGATGIRSDSQFSSGNAGSVEVNARGHLVITAGGLISSTSEGSTFANRGGGNAGSVRVTADRLTIDGSGSEFLTGITSSSLALAGHAGSIDIEVRGQLSILGAGEISSSTHSAGNAGVVRVHAGNVLIDSQNGGDFVSAIFSAAFRDSTGNAGTIEIDVADTLAIVNGGLISSSTSGPGSAGSVRASARHVVVDGYAGDIPSGIIAVAYGSSTGQAGNVSVSAGESISLSNYGLFSIQSFADAPNPAAITPTTLSVSAPIIRLSSFGSISAASGGNVPASNVRIDFGPLLYLQDAGITTLALDGNGGFIRIHGEGALLMRNAAILTSVFGLSGNGGDIDVNARALVMDTAFIQANTAARDASGGDVRIDVQALVPSGGSLFTGGQTPFEYAELYGFNVIQAAAPTGVSGAINISSPILDIASSITTLATSVVDTGGLARALCETSGGSALAQTGRGGPPLSARGLLSAERPLAAPARRPVAFGFPLASIACSR